ncbi:MAG: hypothetical protein FWE88_02990 [Phycisphaerae bacterium]|nr:hypothetical protein [Phycisphaerae bacterium]
MTDNPLPNGFKRLEHMLFLRTPALFVTDWLLAETDGVWVDYQPRNDMPSVTYGNYFGVAFGSSSTVSMGAASYSVGRNWPVTTQNGHIYWGGRYRSITGIGDVDNQRHTHSVNWLNDRTTRWDGSIRDTLPSTSGSFYTEPLCIGGSSQMGAPNSYFMFAGEIYRLKVSRDDQVVRDYVPSLDASGVLVWCCLLTGHVARRLEHTTSTWPEAGPVVPDDPVEPPPPSPIAPHSTATKILNHIVATLRDTGAFAEVSLAATDAARMTLPRADVTFDGLERLALDDAPVAAWRLAAVVRIRVRNEHNDDALRRALDLADKAVTTLRNSRFRGGLCQDIPRGLATVVTETKPASPHRPDAEVRLLVHCHYLEAST